MALKGGSQALRMLLRSGETIFITRAESARIVWTPPVVKNAFALSLFLLAFTIYWVFRF